MEWSLDGTDRTRLGDVRREMLDFLATHAEPGSQLRSAELAFDELVGNACRHAPGPVWVDLDWASSQPVLHVRDCGPGFDLAASMAAAPDGGLQRLTEAAGPLDVSKARVRGADVSVRLPIARAQSPDAAQADGARLIPSPDEASTNGTFGREAFLGAVTVSLAQAVERSHGPAAARDAAATVGAAVGERIEREYRLARQLTDRLTSQQIADLYVELKAAIGGDFYVISVSDDEVVLGNRRCPFGAAVTESPSLCQMTSSVFAGIATRNAGSGDVRLEQRIAVGDAECRVVVSLRDRARQAVAALPAPRAPRLRAVLAEDAAFLRSALVRLLADAGIDVVASCDSARDVVGCVRTYRPDVAIVDFGGASTADALEAARVVRQEHPGTGVLILSEHVAVDSVRELLRGGSTGVGYLLKDRIADVEAFTDRVRCVATGGTAVDPAVLTGLARLDGTDGPLSALTPRECEVLRLLAEGLSNDAIAERLAVTKRAVEKHVGNVFLKLGLPPTSERERRVLAVLAYQDAIGHS